MAIGVDDSKRCGSYAGVDVGYWCKYMFIGVDGVVIGVDCML